MPRRPHRAKEAFEDDPLVDIDCGLLRGLVDELSLTVAEVARRTGDSHQTIRHLYGGEGIGRCRRSRRLALAKALDVPEEMLARGQVFIPHIPTMPDGYEILYSKRTALAVSRLLTKSAKACERDLNDVHLCPPEYETLAPREIIVQYVGSYLSELLQIGEWRKRLIEWDHSEQERRGFTEPATEDPWTVKQRPIVDTDHERAVLGYATAIEHTLSPWFSGKALFNYRTLRDLVHLPKHPFSEMVEAIPDTSPYAILLPTSMGKFASKRKSPRKAQGKRKTKDSKKSSKKRRTR